MGDRRTELVPNCHNLPPEQWVADCWDDMRRRWSRGERVRVEDYLPADYRNVLPTDAIVDLVYGEYILTKENDIAVEHRDFVERFPEIESALQRQFVVDDALSSELPIEHQSTWTGGSHEPLGPVPEKIGKYVVVARIGVGGQAEIYRAVHPALGKEVVLKLARAASEIGVVERERLEAEARMLARIEHPNLARVYDLDFYEERPFLVMEFIRGRTLEQYVRQQQPSAEESAVLLSKIARGVAVAHKCGIAHLDIKPSNVLVDDDGEPKLIDFGLAHLEDAWHDEVLEPNSLRGTLQFMAPEQASGVASEIDYRCDIFALGGLLFFLSTGAPPYPREVKFSELLPRVRACEWDQDQLYRRHIPPAMRSVCLRAMSASAADRYANALAMAKDLEQLSEYATRRRKVLRYGIGATLALLAVAIVWGLGPWGREGGSKLDPNTKEVPVQSPVAAELSIQVWDTDRFRDLTRVASIRTGDRLRIVAQVPAGMHYTMILLDSEGITRELASGKAGDAATEVTFPESGQATPVTGPPGTEMILICGSYSAPLGVDEVRSLWSEPSRLPQLPEESVLRGGPDGVVIEQRGLGLGSPVDVPDAESIVRSRMETLCEALTSRAALFEAIAFCHR